MASYGPVFSTKPRAWLKRTSPKWPILYRLGRKTLTQSINILIQRCTDTSAYEHCTEFVRQCPSSLAFPVSSRPTVRRARKPVGRFVTVDRNDSVTCTQCSWLEVLQCTFIRHLNTEWSVGLRVELRWGGKLIGPRVTWIELRRSRTCNASRSHGWLPSTHWLTDWYAPETQRGIILSRETRHDWCDKQHNAVLKDLS